MINYMKICSHRNKKYLKLIRILYLMRDCHLKPTNDKVVAFCEHMPQLIPHAP